MSTPPSSISTCAYCGHPLPDAEEYCPRCLPSGVSPVGPPLPPRIPPLTHEAQLSAPVEEGLLVLTDEEILTGGSREDEELELLRPNPRLVPAQEAPPGAGEGGMAADAGGEDPPPHADAAPGTRNTRDLPLLGRVLEGAVSVVTALGLWGVLLLFTTTLMVPGVIGLWVSAPLLSGAPVEFFPAWTYGVALAPWGLLASVVLLFRLLLLRAGGNPRASPAQVLARLWLPLYQLVGVPRALGELGEGLVSLGAPSRTAVALRRWSGVLVALLAVDAVLIAAAWRWQEATGLWGARIGAAIAVPVCCMALGIHWRRATLAVLPRLTSGLFAAWLAREEKDAERHTPLQAKGLTCPDCGGRVELEPHGELGLQPCAGCHGTLIASAGSSHFLGTLGLTEQALAALVAQEGTRARPCPACGGEMPLVLLRGVPLRVCRQGKELWLRTGGLARLSNGRFGMPEPEASPAVVPSFAPGLSPLSSRWAVAVLLLGLAGSAALRRDRLLCPEPGVLQVMRSIDGGYTKACTVQGRPHGPLLRRLPDGRRAEQTEHRHGEPHGLHVAWFPDGTVAAAGAFESGSPSGTWRVYSRAGVLQRVERYEKGRLHGERITYFANGQEQERTSWEKGILHGSYSRFDERGQKREEGRYEKGELTGMVQRWREDGTPEPAAAAAGRVTKVTEDPALALRGGRTVEWWGQRLRKLESLAAAEPSAIPLLELTRERAVANGLRVEVTAIGLDVSLAPSP